MIPPLIGPGSCSQKAGTTSESYFNNMNTGNLTPVLFLESLGGLLSGSIENYLPSPGATEISSLNSHSSVLLFALFASSLCREYGVTEGNVSGH